MKNKLNLIVLGSFVLFGFMSLGCQTTKQSGENKPAWLENPNAGDKNNQYLSAIGMGYTEQGAQKNAVGSIAATIQQNISSTITISDSEKSVNGQSSFKATSIDETIQTATIIDDLSGINIKEYWTAEDGTVYALAQMNRNEVASFYSEKINSNNAIIEDNLTYADKDPNSFEAFTHIQRCVPIARQNSNYLTILSVVHNTAFSRLSSISLAELKNKAQEVASKIAIGISVNEDSNDAIYSAVANTLGSYGFTIGKDDGNFPFILQSNLVFNTRKGSKFTIVNCDTTIKLINTKTSITVFADSHTEKCTHKDEALAKHLIYTNISKYILNDYKTKFESFLQ